MEKPFFGIITCTYNSEKYLKKNISSINKQSFTDFQHVFVDGYSTDNTLKILKQYKEKNKRDIRLFRSKPKGISNAMNIGIRKSTAKYLIHLHSDDCLYNSKVLENLHKFLLKNPQCDWVYGKINVVEENGKRFGVFPNRKLFQIRWPYLLKFYNYIPHQAVIIKKDVFENYGYFDEKISSSMDLDYWLRIAKLTNWKFVDKIVSNFTVRPDAQSSGRKYKRLNDKNLINVLSRHLNMTELTFYKIVKIFIDWYNKTLR